MKKLMLIIFTIFVSIYSCFSQPNTPTITYPGTNIFDVFQIIPEDADRTINVGPARTYTTIAEALASTKSLWLNCVITIELDSGSYEWDQDAMDEIQRRIEAVNSSLKILGIERTDVMSGVSLAKLPNRLFGYTMTNAGSTVAEDSLKNLWMADAGETDFYPITYNAAGSDSWEVEFTHHNKASFTEIIQFDATITNSVDDTWLDVDFKNSVNAHIYFEQVNLNAGVYGIFLENSSVQKYFTYVYATGDRFNFSRQTDSYRGSNFVFFKSQWRSTGATGSAVYLNGAPRNTAYFNRSFIDGTANVTNATLSISGGYVTFDKGTVIRGDGTDPAIWCENPAGEIFYDNGLIFRDCNSIAEFNAGLIIVPSASNDVIETHNVNYIFENEPDFDVNIHFPAVNGTLPSDAFADGNFYPFFRGAKGINIEIAGLDSLLAVPEIKWHRIDSIDTPEADAWRTVKFDLYRPDESTWGFTMNSDSTQLIAHFDGIVDYAGCGHWKWYGAAGTAVSVYLRVVTDGNENRCSQTNMTRTIGATNNSASMRYAGSALVTEGSTIELQYRVDDTDMDWEGDATFDNAISFTFHATAPNTY